MKYKITPRGSAVWSHCPQCGIAIASDLFNDELGSTDDDPWFYSVVFYCKPCNIDWLKHFKVKKIVLETDHD